MKKKISTILLIFFIFIINIIPVNAAIALEPMMDENNPVLIVKNSKSSCNKTGTISGSEKLEITAEKLPEGSYITEDSRIFGTFGSTQTYSLNTNYFLDENKAFVNTPDGKKYKLHTIYSTTPPIIDEPADSEIIHTELFERKYELIQIESENDNVQNQLNNLQTELNNKEKEIQKLKNDLQTELNNKKKEIKKLKEEINNLKNNNTQVPEKVKILNLKSKKNSILVKWKKSNNATNYAIYRSKNNKSFKYIRETSKTNFMDKNLKKGKYKYKIKASRNINNNTVINGEFSKITKAIKIR